MIMDVGVPDWMEGHVGDERKTQLGVDASPSVRL